MEHKEPTTLLEAVRQFADPQVAHDYFAALRWPNGVACPRMGCGSADVAKIKNRNAWRCRECNRQFTAKVGTIFEDSPIGFDKWLPAMWLLSANRNGISSCEIARGIGVTQKTAWFMLHRLRLAMQSQTFQKLSGVVEIDETYIGGEWRNKSNRARRELGRRAFAHDAKTPVFGMVQRGGRVIAITVPDTKQKTLLPKMRNCIDENATVFTDGADLYRHINEYFLRHAAVNHSASEYVRGDAHTNCIESFWSVLKRTIGGTYTHVNPRHLDRYLDEQVFRFDERRNADGPRFLLALKGADQRRLTYRQLTRQD